MGVLTFVKDLESTQRREGNVTVNEENDSGVPDLLKTYG